MTYLINSKAITKFKSGSGNNETVDILIFEKALHDFHKVLDKIKKDMPVDIFSILGMRNLSAFIGELFAKSFAKESKNRFLGNPHQDGYPDLLLMDKLGIKLYEEIKARGGLRDKSPFSPFPNGGIEIKATCGSVPSPTQCARLGMEKPEMGETRIAVMRGYDWKAHHRETNNLVGILWDFLDGVPHIVAVFFGNNLTENDWGKIVQPRDGGGRTTSVSIMRRSGVNKMYQNWIAVIEDQSYVKFINKYNRGNLIKL